MAKGGAKVWYFPDGELPPKSAEGVLEAHESLMLFNVHPQPAQARLDFYFKDRDPVKDVEVTVPAERVVNFRMDRPEEIGGVEIPRGVQYALRVRSDVPLIAQFGRLDTTQPNMAFYTTLGLAEE